MQPSHRQAMLVAALALGLGLASTPLRAHDQIGHFGRSGHHFFVQEAPVFFVHRRRPFFVRPFIFVRRRPVFFDRRRVFFIRRRPVFFDHQRVFFIGRRPVFFVRRRPIFLVREGPVFVGLPQRHGFVR
jgi:hypothetical protein